MTIFDVTKLKGDKYSKILRNFLLRVKKRGFTGELKVYENKNERRIYIGYFLDRSFIGRGFDGVGQLYRDVFYSYPPFVEENLKEIPNFWENYAEKGICFLDKKHRWFDSRWEMDGKDRRHCKFCGLKEKRTVKTVIRKYNTWQKTT